MTTGNINTSTVQVNNLAEVTRSLNRVPLMWFDDAKKVFQKATLKASNKTKENCRTSLHIRSGHLAQSIQQEVKGQNLQTLKAAVFSASSVGGSSVKYATIHEFGTTGKGGTLPPIRAIDKYLGVPGGPYLNIPAPANRTPAGVTRFQAREVFAMGGYFRGRTVCLGGQTMFYLKKEVALPPRLGMRAACEEQIPTLLSELSRLERWWG